jgi:hypothetical protein
MSKDGLKPFEPGREKTGGRAKGTRNKLNAEFIAGLAKAFEEHGEAALRVVALTEPAQFLRVIASVIPKEIEITETKLQAITDDDLDTLIAAVRGRLGAVGNADRREDTTAH